MYRRDYIQRLIEQLAEAIARAAGAGRQGRPDEGLVLLNRALQDTSGLDPESLLRLDARSLLAILGPEKTALVADAFVARAELLRLDGKTGEAERVERRALDLAALPELRAGARARPH
jgi:hypothetical protein